MHRRRWMVLWLLIGLPAALWAENATVVVSGNLAGQPQRLERLGFQLYSRAGNKLIGTLPTASQRLWPEGLITLPVSADISRLYLVDRRSLSQVPGAADKLAILYDNGDWLLAQITAETLTTLSSAGVHFRAIGKAMPQQKTLPTPVEIDQINPYVGVILNQVSSSTYQTYLQTLQDFVTRNTYNSQCNAAASWIVQTFQSFGLTTSVDSFQIGSLIRYNIVAEKLGTTQPTQVYFMTAHYDATAGVPVQPEAVAPGADDDASGAAAVLECARIISQYSFNKTVRFVLFAGNEQALIGSEDYVAGLPSTQTYLGDFDADMIGYSGTDPWPPDLVIYHNGTTGSAALAGKIAEATACYESGFLQTILISDPSMIYSDHASFWNRNIPAVLAMEDEAWGEDLNPFYHSTGDLLIHLDIPYAVRVLKVMLASLADMSQPVGSSSAMLTTGNPSINDSLGNNNQQIEYGEFIYLALPVINAGNTSAPNVTVTLSENDPYITLVDNSQVYGTIPALDTLTVHNAFSADISDTVPDDHTFTLTATMISGASQWQTQVQLIAYAPNLIVTQVTVNDTIAGNHNGILEAGETADLDITLQNQGSRPAVNQTASLNTSVAYVSILTGTQSYGTLNPGASIARTYRVSVPNNAPPIFQAPFYLACSGGGWAQNSSFSLSVGGPQHQPTGPDGYGYLAYDSTDLPWGQPYSWVEVDSGQGGPGTPLHYTNGDQNMYVNLPFTFYYYGQPYTEITVNANGWVACGHSTNTSYNNTTIPDPAGPAAMIAPFWDDLQPNINGSVCVYNDAANGRFIVEYYHVRHYNPNTAYETFQVMLFNPAVHPTLTGDGEILMQYHTVALATSCTIGIEDPAQQTGIQYLFNGAYPATATPIADGTAILFSTGRYVPQVQVDLAPINPPIQVPASGGSFSFNVTLANHDTIAYNFDAWCDITLPSGSHYGPTLGPITVTFNPNFSVTRLRNQSVPGSAPAGNYFYNAYAGDYPAAVWSSDAFPFTKLSTGGGPTVAGWDNWGEAFGPEETASVGQDVMTVAYKLEQNFPNPFNPTTAISYQLQATGQVRLTVWDMAGRLVGTLVDGMQAAGQHSVTFDGSKLSSGLYFVRLQAGDYTAVKKMMLIK